MSVPGPTQLRVTGVRKRFGDQAVLDDVEFCIESGEFVTLLGPSGCGKTTLLRIIAGLEIADAGSVRLGDQELLGLPANRRPVNTVFQNYALFPHLNVFDNIAFGLRIRRTGESDVKARVRGAMEMLQLEGLGDRWTNQLSGGQKQRVALARAIVNEPAVLLLDEPMSALDARLRAQVRVELRHLQRRLGRTFLLVTHDQDEAMTVSDRILVMNRGKIEQQGSPHELYEHPTTAFVAQFLGAANLIDARRVDDGVETKFGRLALKTRPAWDTGFVAIRPERVRVVEGAGENRLRARVVEVIYQGDHLEVYLEPGLKLWLSCGGEVRAGEQAWVELPREHLEVLRG